MKTAADLRIPFTWKDRHSVLLDRCLYIPGFYSRHEEWKKIPWEDPSLFGNTHPVAIEYCSGNGQWICERAKQFPHINWVAVEKRFDRARKIWARLHRENLQNLFVVCGEAMIFTKYYAGLASEIFVNFPDPWPKPRHAKHRLIRHEFIDEVQKILLPGAKAYFTTDDRAYIDQMLEVLLANPRWKPQDPPPYYIDHLENFGASYFHDLWKNKGRSIYQLRFEVL